MKILINRTDQKVFGISQEIIKLNSKIGENEEALLTAKMNGDRTEIFFIENELRRLNADREELIETLKRY